VPEETIKAIATTLIKSNTKMEMSKAIPASLRRLRIVFRALTSIPSASLIGIDTAAAPNQLYETGLSRGGIRKRRSND